jgi:hypothetical protein
MALPPLKFMSEVIVWFAENVTGVIPVVARLKVSDTNVLAPDIAIEPVVLGKITVEKVCPPPANATEVMLFKRIMEPPALNVPLVYVKGAVPVSVTDDVLRFIVPPLIVSDGEVIE